MPETRNVIVYTYPENMKPEDKILANATITYEPYEVSDEQLAREARESELQALVNKPTRTNAENTRLLDLLAEKQGIVLPASKRSIRA